ncbi:MAG: hypothetical protein DMG80_02510 [Acidobacteria bacterium]|nr:MAG: hypothetical protein DMG80_02510 [Acidobacteriota bacterium]
MFVHDNIMRNGIQTLDGITWWNDVFVNMTIHYRGGPLALKNVRFVNCRFEVVENQRGQQVLALAILRHQVLQIPVAESSTQPSPTAAILDRSLPLQGFKTK